jgi:seryl-tRNA synthetase
MIHIEHILKNKEAVKIGLQKRNIFVDDKIDIVFEKETERRKNNIKIEEFRARLNKIKSKEEIEFALLIKKELLEVEHQNKIIEEYIYNTLITIPNFANDDVHFGKGYDDNLVIFENENKKLGGPLTHWEIGEKYDIIDFKLGNKLTGNGFPVYKNKGARLQRGLINFCLDEAVKYGFTEYQVPHLVNKDTVYATGQYPDKDNQMYYIEKDDLYLIPTAEVPLTNIYRDTVVDMENLPILLTGYTPCFRREAGGYGRETRGLNRIHQFDKIELVCITTQEDGYNRLEIMREYILTLLDKLELKYRVLKLCGAELPFGGAKAYDIETWCPAQKRWLEVVTVTNFDTFQANRLNCKYKKDGKNKLVHTLNGTGLALPRIVATILETNQFDGGVYIPEALVEYTGFNQIRK